MTISATSAIGEFSRNSSHYRAEQYDSDLGLYYLRARYYNPLTGRFMSRDPNEGDPTDPKTLHKYLYVGGNPASAIDPSGRDEEEYEVLTFKTAYKTVLYAARVICFEVTAINVLAYALPPHKGAFPWPISLGCGIVTLLNGPPTPPSFFFD